MAKLGIAAMVKDIHTGVKPKRPGLDFYDTGTKLYTDGPQPGVQSVSAAHAQTLCWG